MQLLPIYDVAIVGGGLAGLAASILLRRQGHSVVVMEKETYPHHKVCGEYISLESWDFLRSLGLPLQQWNLPLIDTLLLTAPGGKTFSTKLPLGGFGISRYWLDSELAALAENSGVHLLQKTKVDEITTDSVFTIRFQQQQVQAKLCLAAYGKRSNLDVKWSRPFLQQQDKRLNNYVGVKYHIHTNWPQKMIGLHNFENGYCGISKIEDDRWCLCYMTRADNLKQSGNSIKTMEQTVLFQNPHLKKIFSEAQILQSFPVTISQISFAQKSRVENGVLMLGDAAGMITPLCGNGMSIALHTGKLAALLGHQFLQGEIEKSGLEQAYNRQWHHHFHSRLRTGRLLQTFFGSKWLSNVFVGAFQKASFLAQPVIRMTHGEPF
jgi:flavin-dependent dehydrogenase